MRFVLDASALLAAILEEPGAEIVARLLHGSLISSVNLVEVGTRLLDIGYDPSLALQEIDSLGIEVVPFDESLAAGAIQLRASTRAVGLSLGDRACLALAMRERATAVTADRAWQRLDVGCEIELIR